MALQTVEQTAESSNANSNSRVVIDPNSNFNCSSERGLAQEKDDCDSGNSSARSGDDKKERGGGEQRPTSILHRVFRLLLKRKDTAGKKRRRRRQKAREMVNGGKSLPRGEIATLKKAKARAYLSATRGGSVRGDLGDMQSRLHAI